MIVIGSLPFWVIFASFLFGAIYGGLSARRRGGRPADIAQYAVAHGIAFGLLGLFLTIILDRLLS